VRAFKVVFLDSPSGDATNTTEGVPTEAQSYVSQVSGSEESDKNNLTEDVEELPW
jgi:hypothetical protein